MSESPGIRGGGSPKAWLQNRTECAMLSIVAKEPARAAGGQVEPEAVVERVQREIGNYHSQRPARLSTGRSPDRIRAELAALSRALVPPVRGKFAVRDEGIQLTTPEPELTTYWVVAQDPDGTVVFYDEMADEFGLGEATPDGDLETVGVRGDLLSVFLAR